MRLNQQYYLNSNCMDIVISIVMQHVSITFPRSQHKERREKKVKCSKLSSPKFSNLPLVFKERRALLILPEQCHQSRADCLTRAPWMRTLSLFHLLLRFLLLASEAWSSSSPVCAPSCLLGLPKADGRQRKAVPACDICLEAINFLYWGLYWLLLSAFCHYRSFWHCFSSLQEAVESYWSHCFKEVTRTNKLGFPHSFA